MLVSTGQGSHIVLFSYYALLNLAILGIAWRRAWRVLNLLGFVATFGIGTAWGVLQYDPGQFASAEPFLVLNFLFYLLIPWLYLRHPAARFQRVMDGSLLFGAHLTGSIFALVGAGMVWLGFRQQRAWSRWGGHAAAVVVGLIFVQQPLWGWSLLNPTDLLLLLIGAAVGGCVAEKIHVERFVRQCADYLNGRPGV